MKEDGNAGTARCAMACACLNALGRFSLFSFPRETFMLPVFPVVVPVPAVRAEVP
jgi:hypothetical protein